MACKTHGQELILMCIKDKERICSKCLKTTHLLHPVVPLNESLDFTESLQIEIQTALSDVNDRSLICHDEIVSGITEHKKNLRDYVLRVRSDLHEDFDSFFNDLLNTIRKDWNLFTIQETLVKEVKTFSKKVLE